MILRKLALSIGVEALADFEKRFVVLVAVDELRERLPFAVTALALPAAFVWSRPVAVVATPAGPLAIDLDAETFSLLMRLASRCRAFRTSRVVVAGFVAVEPDAVRFEQFLRGHALPSA